MKNTTAITSQSGASNKIQICEYNFPNGVTAGYYVVDARGVNWQIEPTRQLALDSYNRLNKTDIKIFELQNRNKIIQVGDVISFYTSCNEGRERMIGLVEYKEQLGFITVVNNVQYELRKLINIDLLKQNENVKI